MFFILFMMIFSVLILSPIGAADKKTDMVKVIFSTKSGKTGYYRDLFLYGILCGIFRQRCSFSIYFQYSEKVRNAGTIRTDSKYSAIFKFRYIHFCMWFYFVFPFHSYNRLYNMFGFNCRYIFTLQKPNISLYY